MASRKIRQGPHATALPRRGVAVAWRSPNGVPNFSAPPLTFPPQPLPVPVSPLPCRTLTTAPNAFTHGSHNISDIDIHSLRASFGGRYREEVEDGSKMY